MADHARLAPSSASIWMACPGQPILAARAPDSTSRYAAEGTFYHEIAAECLSNGWLADRFDGHKGVVEGFTFEADAENLAHVQTYLDHVRGLVKPGDELLVEERLIYDDDLWGTGDAVVLQAEDKHLHIVDLKFGKGVVVGAEDNRQLECYGIMAMRRFPKRVRRLTMTIVQPRAPQGGETIRSATIDLIDAMDAETDIMAAVRAYQAACEFDDGPPEEWDGLFLDPGPHCSNWCAAAGFCPALKHQALKAVETEFSVIPFTPEQLADALGKVKMVEAWAKAVTELGYSEANAGRTPPGYKLVQKRAVRKWVVDDDNLVAVLKKHGYDPADFQTVKVATPAQTEKKLKKEDKNIIDGLSAAESSGTVLAPESDKRPAVTNEPDFAPVPNETSEGVL